MPTKRLEGPAYMYRKTRFYTAYRVVEAEEGHRKFNTDDHKVWFLDASTNRLFDWATGRRSLCTKT